MKGKKGILITLATLVAMLILTTMCYGQCDPFIDPNCEDIDVDTPLDQWVVYLAVVPFVIGVKKIYDTDKETIV